jgi:DNA polymerase III sliding clamp (beta) subunit (PCNA family)
VATDGQRLTLSSRSLGKAIPNATGIVPRKAVTETMRVLGAGEEIQIAQKAGRGVKYASAQAQFPSVQTSSTSLR